MPIDIEYAMAYNNRGFLQNDRGEMEKALADYNQVIYYEVFNLSSFTSQSSSNICGQSDISDAKNFHSLLYTTKIPQLLYFTTKQNEKMFKKFIIARRLLH
ncbi:unnamed protein product [Paramecium sonneborni]|uniref:Photosystem I assembly protein Ycf3 n=1 Tax=Paramecium sonneborni TaxID=65129 RepID=A0A8S1RWR3_9CILI|nr:unnamed protein product [Paramecium sonneborni]